MLSNPRCTSRRLSFHDADPRCHACTALFGIAFSEIEVIAPMFILEMKYHPRVKKNENLLLPYQSIRIEDHICDEQWSSAYTRPYRRGNADRCQLTLIKREIHSKNHALALTVQDRQAEYLRMMMTVLPAPPSLLMGKRSAATPQTSSRVRLPKG